ncbi:MAG: hypothetical protein DMD81_22550 [Candidatus Rokuibacteriota bacterium]|nr:MAG: hypothetical protein DMD81_22550 [Candidatus Rokubacteria bacterium]
MIELLVVLALLAGTFVVFVLPWPTLLIAGSVTTAVGLVFGVATGLWYHIALAQVLSAKRALTPRWWLRPSSLHDRMDTADQRRVMPWFYAGAVGFVVTVAGLALLTMAVVGAAWRR